MAKKLSKDQIFIENSSCDDSTIKRHYLKEIAPEDYKCVICGTSHWQDQPLTLQLDHINGKHTDNRWNNLRLLCANCHTQTDTYAGRNGWAASTVTDEQLSDAINKSSSISEALREVGMDVGRIEYFAKANYLIKSGTATLNKTTFSIVFG